MDHEVVFVTGMHRSGTSCVAELVCSSGVDFGQDLISPASDNLRGFFESKKVVELNDKLLGGFFSWKNINPDVNAEPEVEEEKKAYFAEMALSCEGVFGVKDPRFCYTLREYDFIDDKRVVVSIRSPESVVGSLQRRDQLTHLHAGLLWLSYHYRLFNVLVEGKIDFILIDYDRLCSSDVGRREAEKLEHFLTRPVDFGVVDKALNNHSLPVDAEQPSKDTLDKCPVINLANELHNILVSDFSGENVKGVLGKVRKFIESYSELSDEICHAITVEEKYETELQNLLGWNKKIEAEIKLLQQRVKEQDNEIERLPAWIKGLSLKDRLRKFSSPKQHKIIQRVFSAAKIRLVRSLSSLSDYVFTMGESSMNLSAINDLTKVRQVHVDSLLHGKNSNSQLPVITMSIVTFNSEKWIKPFFLSLMGQLYPLDKIKLCIVDHSDKPKCYEVLKEYECEYGEKFLDFNIFKRENLGFGAGHNYAVKNSDSEYVLITNIDIEFCTNTIVNLVRCALSSKSREACWEPRQVPYEHPKYYDPVTLETNWCSHACILIDKAKFDSVGGYDENIFMYCEDVDLSYAFRRDGFVNRYVPSAVVVHNTYEQENEVKPLQAIGSLKGSVYLRAKYGKVGDAVVGPCLLLSAALREFLLQGGNDIYRKNVVPSINLFLKGVIKRKHSDASFPFRFFDYEMSRPEPFYNSLKNYKSMTVAGDALPTVTVITRTVEGREGLLEECMCSVLNQTYPRIEHLVVQDGGSSSESIVDRFNNRREGLSTRFISCPPSGRSHAGNIGMHSAAGDLLLFLDDDDLLFADHLETLYGELSDTGANAAYSLAWDVKTEIKNKACADYKEFDFRCEESFYQTFDRQVLSKRNYIPIQSILFQKKLFDELGGFEEGMECLEDWVLWKKYSLDHEFSFVKKLTSLYRTPYRLSDKIARQKMFYQAYESAEKLYKYSG